MLFKEIAERGRRHVCLGSYFVQRDFPMKIAEDIVCDFAVTIGIISLRVLHITWTGKRLVFGTVGEKIKD